MLPITSAILFASRGKTYIKPPPLSRQVSTVLEGTPWFFLISGKTSTVLAHSHTIFVSRMTSWVALLWFPELTACHMPWLLWQHHCPVERREERSDVSRARSWRVSDTQLQRPWKLPRRMGAHGVMELKGMTANSHKSTERWGSCLQRAQCYGLQGVVARVGSVGFCVPCSSSGEGFPMCPERVFFCVCSALLNSSLPQGWGRGWWSKVEKLLGLLLLNR